MALDLKAMEGMAYTAEDVAQLLHLHPDTIRRLIRDRRLRAVRPPGSRIYIILGEDLARYFRGEPPLDPGEGGEEPRTRRRKQRPSEERILNFEGE